MGIIDEIIVYIEEFTPFNKITKGIFDKVKSLKEKEQKLISEYEEMKAVLENIANVHPDSNPIIMIKEARKLLTKINHQ